jgi:hypothetical protein
MEDLSLLFSITVLGIVTALLLKERKRDVKVQEEEENVVTFGERDENGYSNIYLNGKPTGVRIYTSNERLYKRLTDTTNKPSKEE